MRKNPCCVAVYAVILAGADKLKSPRKRLHAAPQRTDVCLRYMIRSKELQLKLTYPIVTSTRQAIKSTLEFGGRVLGMMRIPGETDAPYSIAVKSAIPDFIRLFYDTKGE